jgi:hypothetical protein
VHAKHGIHTKGRTEAILNLLEDWIERFLGRRVQREAGSNPKCNKREGDIAFSTTLEMPSGTIYLDHTCVSILTRPNEKSALEHAENLLNEIAPSRSLTSRREEEKIKKYVPGYRPSTTPKTMKQATDILYNPIALRKGHYFIGVASALFGGLGPVFSALIFFLAQKAYALGEFSSVAEANQALTAEVVRTQMEHCMMTMADYMHPCPRPVPVIIDDLSDTE